MFGENGYHAVGTRELAEAAGANQAASEDAIGFTALEPYARAEQRETHPDRAGGAPGRTHAGSVICQERHDADHQQ